MKQKTGLIWFVVNKGHSLAEAWASSVKEGKWTLEDEVKVPEMTRVDSVDRLGYGRGKKIERSGWIHKTLRRGLAGIVGFDGSG